MARKKREEAFDDDGDESKEEEGPRSFARFIELLADGEAHCELSETLQKLGIKLQEEAERTCQVAKGEIVLRLRFKVEDNGIAGVGYEIKVKEPEPARPGSVFWLTKGGNLTPENPRQQKLPLIDVNSRRAPARDVQDGEFAEVRSV